MVTGQYRFTLSIGNADTASISVDGSEIARSGCAWDSSFSGDIDLTAGEHKIQVLYVDDGWTDKAVLSYQGPDTGMSLVVVPADKFVSWPANGECVGNDSRCKGSNEAKCKALGAEGSDCRWEVPAAPGAPGTCLGNDSRCSGSSHAKCMRLSDTGSDCRWESSLWSGSPGTCLGNDSRCSGSTEPTCNFLTREGSDCKWRNAFRVNGSMIMNASDVDGFVSSPTVKYAVVDALSNVTGIPSEYIDVDIAADDKKRRLRARQLSESGNLKVTYVIPVPGDAPPTVQGTGAEVGDRLKATSRSTMEHLISANVAESEVSEAFTLSIQSMEEPEVVVKPASEPASDLVVKPPSQLASDPEAALSGAKMETLAAYVAAMCIIFSLSSLPSTF